MNRELSAVDANVLTPRLPVLQLPIRLRLRLRAYQAAVAHERPLDSQLGAELRHDSAGPPAKQGHADTDDR